MKKLLTILALLAFTSSVYAANGWTKFTNKVNNGMNNLSRKEQALNNKIDKAQAERAAQRAEVQRQQEARRKAIEAKEKELKAQEEANKKAIREEVGFWKGLFGRK